jgi:hypothetical protein
MNFFSTALLSAALCLSLLTGCGKASPRTQNEKLNNPHSKSEAIELMRSVDKKGAELNWEPQELQYIRRQMKGRLLSAGMSEKDINSWIESELRTNTLTNKRSNN